MDKATDYSTKTLTVDQMADMLHVTPHTVYQRLRFGTLTAHKSGRRWLFTREDVEAAMNSGTCKSRSSAKGDGDD